MEAAEAAAAASTVASLTRTREIIDNPNHANAHENVSKPNDIPHMYVFKEIIFTRCTIFNYVSLLPIDGLAKSHAYIMLNVHSSKRSDDHYDV